MRFSCPRANGEKLIGPGPRARLKNDECGSGETLINQLLAPQLQNDREKKSQTEKNVS